MALNEILTGWANVIKKRFDKLSPELKETAKERLEICNTCIHRKRNKCTKCGCNLSAKTLSPTSKCPVGKW